MPTKSKDPGSWVDRLVADPAAPPQLQVLSGYRGRAATEDGVRLYQQADLSSWVDVPTAAVLHESEAPDALGLARTWMWVSAETALTGGSQGTSAGEGWLGGPIATALGDGSEGLAVGLTQTGPNCPFTVACDTLLGPECATRFSCGRTPACIPRTVQCPTPATKVCPATSPGTTQCMCPNTFGCPPPSVPQACPPANWGDQADAAARVSAPRTTTQLPTGIDPRCPTNVCTIVGCRTSYGPLCPNPPQPQAAAFEPEAQAATAFCASAACPPVTQFCPQPTHFCPPSVVCPPRTTLCPTNICPTNAQVCATLTNACNTLFCPTQHATCPPSFGGGLCPTMVCDPFGGR